MSEIKSQASATTSQSAPTYASATATKPSSGVTLCLSYFTTCPGIIKLVQLVIGIICMACAAPAWTDGTHWFLFVVVTAFVATILWSFIYLLNLRSAITLPIDWLLTELLNTSITTILYLIIFIVQFCTVEAEPVRNYFAGFFGIVNFCAYAAGCFYLYREWKESHPHNSFSGGVIRRNP